MQADVRIRRRQHPNPDLDTSKLGQDNCGHTVLADVARFGKHEAEGRRFHDVITQGVARGVPVLVGLIPLNKPAFDIFKNGLAQELPTVGDDLVLWITQWRKVAA